MKLAFTPLFLFALPLLPSVSAQSIFARQAKGAGNAKATNGTSKGGGNNGTADNGNTGNPQTSLTLDPKVIAKGFASDGQENATPGQAPSLTSTDNFINFCLTTPNLPITNGQQIKSGSCNPAPMGIIPSVDKMPSCKFVNPKNNDTIPANQSFQIKMSIQNLITGNFVNAESNYYSAPQHLDNNGFIIGHSHVVVQLLTSFDQTAPLDPQKFAFFKGVNEPAQGGILTVDVTNGLPSGVYRLCSINAAANHQPVLVAIAQHGSLDDCVYFTATTGGVANGNGSGAGAAGTTNNSQGKANNGSQGGKNGQGKRWFIREVA
ncbi:hypothetical protein AX15_001135 [Amanita polypyramis BW_CC]|nr:hypothetical protein AX15_001135 [Amanita polypyramis BW_CC]